MSQTSLEHCKWEPGVCNLCAEERWNWDLALAVLYASERACCDICFPNEVSWGFMPKTYVFFSFWAGVSNVFICQNRVESAAQQSVVVEGSCRDCTAECYHPRVSTAPSMVWSAEVEHVGVKWCPVKAVSSCSCQPTGAGGQRWVEPWLLCTLPHVGQDSLAESTGCFRAPWWEAPVNS